ncbi:hypothetical protein B4098_0393 [Heyndrickxia coagulans]|uniref:Uncharacterized protein n=1 Tax=Heyndrickxia coagulans TaxID=1398 RepID=A0A150K182_HEYCO|nr:hypothetical protein B4098_0393 [Heyndrickxia coagulans]
MGARHPFKCLSSPVSKNQRIINRKKQRNILHRLQVLHKKRAQGFPVPGR